MPVYVLLYSTVSRSGRFCSKLVDNMKHPVLLDNCVTLIECYFDRVDRKNEDAFYKKHWTMTSFVEYHQVIRILTCYLIKIWSNCNSICQTILTDNLRTMFDESNLGTNRETSVLFAVMNVFL